MRILYKTWMKGEDSPKKRHEMGQLLLHKLLQEEGISGEICYEASGQPICVNAQGERVCYVSISHTLGGAVVAVHDAPVGVDVERVDRVVPRKTQRRLRTRVFSSDICLQETTKEQEKWSEELLFLADWTRHEAFGKMLGTGLLGISPEMVVGDLEAVCVETQVEADLMISTVWRNEYVEW